MDVNQAVENLTAIKRELIFEIQRLKYRYLSRYIDEIDISPTEYEHDAKTFIILSHAVLENFIESVAEISVAHAIYKYKFEACTTETILQFCYFRQASVDKSLSEDVWENRNRDVTTKSLEQAVNEFKNYLNMDNHGIKLKHLNQILRPAGLDLKNDPALLNELDKLTNLRGKFAHRYMERGQFKRTKIDNVDGPEKILKAVTGVISLFSLVHLKALMNVINSSKNNENVKGEILNLLVFELKRCHLYTGIK